MCQIAPNPNRQVFATPYQHWYSDTRATLFASLSYNQARSEASHISIGKIGERAHSSILRKVFSKKVTLDAYTISLSNHPVFFHDGPTYWIRAMAFNPNLQGSRRSTHYKTFNLGEEGIQKVTACILNSSLFYLFYKTFSNCRDLLNKEIATFPIGTMPPELVERVKPLEKTLTDSYIETRELKSRVYPSGKIEYYEYYPVRSKTVIDAIDRVLAQHYGFTDEELDFIINYDIKYRMGDQLLEEEGEEE